MSRAWLCTVFILVLWSGVELVAQAPDWAWAARAGNTATDIGQAVATDSQGNSYVAGRFEGSVNFGSTNLVSQGQDDIFVARLDSTGNWIWAVRAGGSGSDQSNAIAFDSEGNVYVAGRFQLTAFFTANSIMSSGGYDVFVAKMSPEGNWQWAVRGGGSSEENASALGVDDAGDVWVTGGFYGTAYFGTTQLAGSTAEQLYAAKLDSSGNWLWAVQAGGAGNDIVRGLVCATDGHAYLTGAFAGTANFGNNILISNTPSFRDAFVACLAPDGVWLWAVSGGGTSFDEGHAIARDAAGNLYISGTYGGTAVFGAHQVANYGGTDIFVAKLGAGLDWQWLVHAGGNDNDDCPALASDAAGNLYLGGYYRNSGTFGGTVLTNAGYYDLFAAKLDSAGNWLWATRAGSPNGDYAYGLALGAGGSAYLTGSFQGTAVFGAHTLTGAGGADVFIAKLGALALPQSPQNLSLTIAGDLGYLVWDPVTQDTSGQALSPDAYRVYASQSGDPWGGYTYLGQSLSAEFWLDLSGVAEPGRRFYRVTAVKD